MAKVLVVDHQSAIRKSMTGRLRRSGYEVSEATNGKAALEIASGEVIDLMLLDVDMPGMDGGQVLATLKGDPRTRLIPVIMLTSFPSYETEAVSLRSGASNVLTKPCKSETLETHVRVAIREGQAAAEKMPRVLAVPAVAAEEEPDMAVALPDPDPELMAYGQPRGFIGTGGRVANVEAALDGGLAARMLALIEGPSESGKSVICQYLMFGAISEGWEVAYFSSDETAERLTQQMGSIGMDVARPVQDNKLAVYPIAKPSGDENPDSLLSALASEIQRLPESRGLVVLDSITHLALLSQDRPVMNFFSTCQKLCSAGRAILIVAQSSGFDPALLGRLHQLCNTHIGMTTQMVRDKPAMALNAGKVNNLEKRTDNGFNFRVEPEVGISIVPMSRIRV